MLRLFLQGYISQLISIALLIGQNLILPKLIGIESYGFYTYSFSFTFLARSFMQDGVALLMLSRRPNSQSFYFYLVSDIIATTIVFLVLSSLSLASGSPGPATWLAFTIQTCLSCIYNAVVMQEITSKRNDLLFISTINNGLMCFSVPLTLSILGRQDLLEFSYVLIISESLAASIVLNSINGIRFDWSLFARRVRLFRAKYLLMIVAYQFKLSITVTVWGIITWGSFLLAKSQVDIGYATCLRISLSIVALTIGLTPLHRYTTAALISEHSAHREILRLAIGSAWIFFFAVLTVWALPDQMLSFFFSDKSTTILDLLTILIFVAPLKFVNDLASLYLNAFKGSKDHLLLNIFLLAAFAIVFLLAVPFHYIHYCIVAYYLILGISSLILLRHRFRAIETSIALGFGR